MRTSGLSKFLEDLRKITSVPFSRIPIWATHFSNRDNLNPEHISPLTNYAIKTHAETGQDALFLTLGAMGVDPCFSVQQLAHMMRTFDFELLLFQTKDKQQILVPICAHDLNANRIMFFFWREGDAIGDIDFFIASERERMENFMLTVV